MVNNTVQNVLLYYYILNVSVFYDYTGTGMNPYSYVCIWY